MSVLLPIGYRRAIRTAPQTGGGGGGIVLPSDQLFPNAPLTAGWTTVTDVRWDEAPVGDLPIWTTDIYEADDGGHMVNYVYPGTPENMRRCATRVTDTTVPGGMARALLCRFPTALGGGTSAVNVQIHPSYSNGSRVGPLQWPASLSTGSLYIGLYIRLSSGFTQNGNNTQKVLYAAGTGNSANHIPIALRPPSTYTPPGEAQYPDFTPQEPFGTYTMEKVAGNNINDAAWHLIEMETTPGTPGVADGTIKFWKDDTVAGSPDYSTSAALLFNAGQTPNYSSIYILPVYGGGLNSPPQELSMWLGPMLIRSK